MRPRPALSKRSIDRRRILRLVLLVAAIALLPECVPADPMMISNASLAPPDLTHPFGTDQLGRDLLSRVLHGVRLSVIVAVGAVAIAVCIGGAIGIAAGYLGGWIDSILSRTTESLFALPDILLALVIMAVLGPGMTKISLAIGIVYTPIFARLARSQTRSILTEPYVEAARALGAGPMRIMSRHLLPNIAGSLAVQAALSAALAILAEAALGYLGLGGQPDAPTLGNILRSGKDWLEQAWWITLFPGLALTAVVFGFTNTARRA